MYRVEIFDSESNHRLEILGTYSSTEEAEVAGEAYIEVLLEDEKFYTEYCIVDLSDAKYRSQFRQLQDFQNSC